MRPQRYRLQRYTLIVVDQMEREYPSVRMSSLKKISAYIEFLDEQFAIWEATWNTPDGVIPTPTIPILAHYEGCDVYVLGPDGAKYILNGHNGWERVE